jgi:tetratricopeptide (TPR) repeat protein
MSITRIAPRLRKYARQGRGKTTGPRHGWTPEMLARREEALGPNPSGGYNHDDLGCEFYHAGLWNRAVSEFERAVQINPWKAAFKVHLARAYLAMDHLAKAKTAAQSALKQSPDSPEALLTLGIVCEKEGNFRLARILYERCLSHAPHWLIRRDAEENLRRNHA